MSKCASRVRRAVRPLPPLAEGGFQRTGHSCAPALMERQPRGAQKGLPERKPFEQGPMGARPGPQSSLHPLGGGRDNRLQAPLVTSPLIRAPPGQGWAPSGQSPSPGAPSTACPHTQQEGSKGAAPPPVPQCGAQSGEAG